MGKIPHLAIVLAFMAAPAAAQPVPAQPKAPAISLSQGTALVDLARSAMRDFLTKRTPADRQVIPESLRDLSESQLGVCLVLRQNGKTRGESTQRAKGLPRNVIAAALEAMRSPDLPDRVTAEVLAQLVMELEVLGEPQDVDANQLPGMVVPGLMGLMASRGLDDAVLSASWSCQADLDAEATVRACISLLPVRAETRGMPIRWAAMGACDYVGYPDGRVLWLYRGKALAPPETVDRQALQDAAEQIGLFLLRNQDKDGRLSAPQGQAPLDEHLYAAWALGQLARRTNRKDFAAGLNAALGYAMRHLEQQEDTAYFKGLAGEEQTGAMALLALAIAEAPDSPAGREIQSHVLAGLRRGLAAAGQAPSTQPAATPAYLKARALACLAVQKAAGQPAELEDLRPQAFRAIAPDAETALWQIRAGLPKDRDWTGLRTSSLPLPVASGGPLDEAGGFAPKGQAPRTAATALAAVVLSIPRTWPGLTAPSGPAEAESIRKAQILAAQRFCQRMVYKPRETYFCRQPDRWIGGVRASPQGAGISLAACAAAIEALLAE